MESSSQLEEIAQDIDRLITLDVNRRGVIQILYQAAREKMGQPLVLAASKKLDQAIEPGSVVLVATGWPDRPWITPNIGELDGPPGAGLLARNLHRVLGAVPFFLIEKELKPAMMATARAAGFAVLPPQEARDAFHSQAPLHAASVLDFPKDISQAEEESSRLIDTYSPRAVISVEKGSANVKGVIHNSRGQDTTEYMAKVDELVREARQRGILTLGIGDGGNEVGMGFIAQTIREHIPYGSCCSCPCGAGIAPALPTDVLVASSVSNWGCYGIAACMSVLKSQANALHDEAMELRTLREAADAGLIDGNTGYVDPGADGIAAASHAAIITVLRQIVFNALLPAGLALETGGFKHSAGKKKEKHKKGEK
ncbi:MAG: glutamate cyclase domain-containing protein [Candidatus Aminicenantes bacterium]